MNKVSKFVAISCAATVAAFAVAGSASAHEWHRRYYGGGDALAAGVAGLAVGVIAGAAIASPPPPRRYYYDDGYYAPATAAAPCLLSPGLCLRATGSGLSSEPRAVVAQLVSLLLEPLSLVRPAERHLIGYDGRQHFCTAG